MSMTARRARLQETAPSRAWLDVSITALLAATTLFLILPAFGTSTLWRDDAWTTLTMKTGGVSEFFLVAANAPGFAAMLKAWLAAVGFDEWKAQLVPLVFAVATPPLLYIVLVRRALGRVGAATGALLMAVSPDFLTNAARVKQYTLDAFCVVCVLGLALWLLDDVTSAKRWRTLAVGGVAALVFSSPSVVFLVAALGTGLLGLLMQDRTRLRVALLPVAAAGTCTALWSFLVLRPAVTPALTLFWEAAFVPLDDGPRQAVIATVVTARRFVHGAISISQAEAAAAVLAGAYLIVLWRRALLGLLLLAPLAIAFVLAVLKIAPLGTGRTDIYLYPAVMAAVAIAVDTLAKRARRATGIAAVAAVAALIVSAPRPAYPLDDVAPLVAEVEARSTPADAIVTYPFASYQFALYTKLPLDVSRTNVTATGFRLRFPQGNIFVPTESWPRDALNFAATMERVRRRHDSVWVIVSAKGDPVAYPAARPGASGTERFSAYREEYALPFELRALRQAFAGDHVPANLRQTTVQQYVDRLMRRAGYRRSTPSRVRAGASLTHWQR